MRVEAIDASSPDTEFTASKFQTPGTLITRKITTVTETGKDTALVSGRSRRVTHRIPLPTVLP